MADSWRGEFSSWRALISHCKQWQLLLCMKIDMICNGAYVEGLDQEVYASYRHGGGILHPAGCLYGRSEAGRVFPKLSPPSSSGNTTRSRNTSRIIRAGLLPVVAVLFLLASTAPVTCSVSQAAQIAGYVYTRSSILSESGNRIWCEYAQDGSIVRDLAEATGEYDPALGCFVLSGQEYQSCFQAYQDLQASYPGLGLPLSRQDYLASDFFTAGGDPIVKPSLRASTNFVVVLPQEMRLLAEPDQLILSEYPVDPTAVVPPTACSLLIGQHGDILVWSNNRIGFKAGFLSSEQGSVYDPDQYRLRKSTDTIHGPIGGVWVERPGYSGTYTDDQGRYTLRWYSVPCPYSGYTISSYATARLYSRRFNPKAGTGPRPYYVFRTFTEACSPDPLNFEHLHTFGFMTGSLASPSSMGNHVTYPDALDFLVDTTVLAGRAYLSQGEGRAPEVIPVGQGTAYGLSGFAPQRSSSAYYDFDGDGTNDTVVVGSLQADPEDPQSTIFVPGQEDTAPEDLVQGVYLSASGTDPAEGQPDFTRMMDWTPNVGHEGLLSCISTGDLMNTDMYVFRVSDGKLITERVGLRQEDIGGLDWGVDGAQARYFYRMEMRGSFGDRAHNLSQSMADYADWQAESGMNPELFEQRSDHLKPGDRIRIVAINRTSGYTGSVYTDMQSPGSSGGADLSFEIDEIVMTPANLKVWVERDYNITAGLSRGEIRKEQIIGFEGAGLSSDTFIAVHTEWLDADGSPLPEELTDAGFTGRLVCLSGDRQLPGNEGGGLYHFAIDPGRHIQVLQIPQDKLSSQHFYIQVSGEPISGTPVFYNNVSRGSPDFTSTGANPGRLSSRPDRYVPFLVPVFDEEATEIRRQAYREALAGNPGAIKPEPFYRWCYRPEMQYSLYDLEISAINRQIDETTSENILESDSIISCEDDWAEILYSLSTTELLPMDYIDLAGDKELVFSVGGQEVTATIGADQSIRFDNLAHLALLEAEDFLTMRLYTNNDAGNVLWEYVLFTPGEIVVKNDAGDEAVEEICLSNRVNLRKRYHIELPDMPPSYDLKKLHGHIRVVDREGKVVTVPASGSPGDTKYAAVEYPLEFVREGERVCAVIKVDENETRGRCIFTNLGSSHGSVLLS